MISENYSGSLILTLLKQAKAKTWQNVLIEEANFAIMRKTSQNCFVKTKNNMFCHF